MTLGWWRSRTIRSCIWRRAALPPAARRTDALPGCDLGVDHDAELVAGVEKHRRLRVVGESHEVATQVLEDLGVAALQFVGEGAAETQEWPRGGCTRGGRRGRRRERTLVVARNSARVTPNRMRTTSTAAPSISEPALRPVEGGIFGRPTSWIMELDRGRSLRRIVGTSPGRGGADRPIVGIGHPPLHHALASGGARRPRAPTRSSPVRSRSPAACIQYGCGRRRNGSRAGPPTMHRRQDHHGV